MTGNHKNRQHALNTPDMRVSYKIRIVAVATVVLRYRFVTCTLACSASFPTSSLGQNSNGCESCIIRNALQRVHSNVTMYHCYFYISGVLYGSTATSASLCLRCTTISTPTCPGALCAAAQLQYVACKIHIHGSNSQLGTWPDTVGRI